MTVATALYLGDDLERLVAAVVAATGVHVERGLEIRNILEIDVMATSFHPLHRMLLEAKSGGTGVGDVFKVESQHRYLSSSQSALVVPVGSPADMEAIGTWGGIGVVRTDLTRPDVIAKVSTYLGTTPPSHLIDAWERAFKVEDYLERQVSSSPVRKTYPTVSAAWTAHFGVHGPGWTNATIEERCRHAYGAFSTAPHAALEHGCELDGLPPGTRTSYSFRRAVYEGERPTVLGLAHLEWRNRLEVMRLAVEYALHGPATISGVPGSFAAAVTALRAKPALAPLVPAVAQAFVYRWGGFLVDGRPELATAGAEFGLSAADFAEVIGLIDDVFPMLGRSWMTLVRGVEWLRLVAFLVQGLGALYRDDVMPGWDAGLGFWPKGEIAKRRRATLAVL